MIIHMHLNTLMKQIIYQYIYLFINLWYPPRHVQSAGPGIHFPPAAADETRRQPGQTTRVTDLFDPPL